jgi:fructose-bisphosphate aldolase class II
MSHVQSGDMIKIAADVPGYPFDNIMVGKSQYEKEENLAKTEAMTEDCHA